MLFFLESVAQLLYPLCSSEDLPGGGSPLPAAEPRGAHWVSSAFLPDLRGDRRCVWDRHLPGGDRQHFCCLQVGVNQE